MLFPILGLVGFAGVVISAALLIVMILKGKKLLLPRILFLVSILLVGASVFMIIREDSEPADKSASSQSTVDRSEPDKSKEDKPDKSEKSKPGAMSADNISYDVHMTADGNMLVFFTNNNAETVPEFDVEVTFYDKNKQMLGVDTDGHDAVLPNAKVVSTFDVPRNDNRTAIKEFDYEISIKAKDNNSYENLSSDLVIDSNTGNNGVVARFTNNSDKEIEELEVVAVYYKDGKVIGSDENEKHDIASGDYVTIEFYRPYDESSHVIDFDDYEIVVNQAHNFGLY